MRPYDVRKPSLLGKPSRIVGPAVVVAMLVAGCGASGGGQEGSGDDVSGERVPVGETEGIVWGEGDRGVVLAHGAAYDAASWEPQGRALAEDGVAALAVEDTSPGNLGAAVGYLAEERGAGSVSLIGASAGSGPVLRTAEENPGEVEVAGASGIE